MRTPNEEEKELELAPLRDAGGRTPLFCLPGAGGEVSIFKELASQMDGDQSVYAIDMQRFFAADRKFTVERLAELCCSVISAAQAHGPYHLCGYSFGAVVAYEVASRLKRNGEDVRVVVLIDTGNPAFRHQQSSAETKQTQKTYLSNRIGKYSRFLASGDIRQFASSFLALFASRAGVRTRRLIRRAFLAVNRPMPFVFRNNDRTLVEAWLAYNPPPSALPLLLFYEAHRRAEYGGDRTLGWRLCASETVDVELASGGHVEMMEARHVRGLAARLSEIIKRQAE
jgi:thioesterase domain-containing protein